MRFTRVTSEQTPMVPDNQGGLAERALRALLPPALRASLLFSPVPAALLVRRIFAANGAKQIKALERHAPSDVVALLNRRYGEQEDMVLDVFHPESVPTSLPLLFWVHGGGFVGGAKEEIAGYLKLIAHHGYVVAAPRYSLAPKYRYPTPPRQTMKALEYLIRNAVSLMIDVDRIALAGDSAGAHIAAQIGAMITTPGYAGKVGISPTTRPEQLRCLILACGPYDLASARHSSSAAGAVLIKVVLWSYSGTRHALDDPSFATWSITDNVSPAFPPTLLTVGNTDPLRPHSELLAERLRAHGVQLETLFFPDDYQPPLGHEYQFDLDSDAGQRFLERLLAFLRDRMATLPA